MNLGCSVDVMKLRCSKLDLGRQSKVGGGVALWCNLNIHERLGSADATARSDLR